jgi:general secretion pathway protein E
VRVLDDTTKVPHTATEYECNILGVDPADPPTLYHPGEGTNGGFVGRTGIYELIAVDDEMRAMVHNGVSEQDLDRHARKSSPSIRADGRRRVLEGTTTLEELLRVTRED